MHLSSSLISFVKGESSPPEPTVVFMLFAAGPTFGSVADLFPNQTQDFSETYMSDMPDLRKLAAKQTNEVIKITATFANNLAVGVIVGGLVGPLSSAHYSEPALYIALGVSAGTLHFFARESLKTLKSEDEPG